MQERIVNSLGKKDGLSATPVNSLPERTGVKGKKISKKRVRFPLFPQIKQTE
jgi:hypothetical protein